MDKLKIINYSILVFVLAAGWWLAPGPAEAAAASLYLSPSSGTKTINTNFTVTVKVNTDNEVINAAQGTINYDPAVLTVVSVSRGGSIFSLWTAEPAFNNTAGTINFGGGIPQPGYKGTGGTICTVTFKGRKAGTADVRFTAGAVLANDGKGTNILGSLGSASFTIAPAAVAPKAEEPKPATPAAPGEPAETEYNTPKISSLTHPDQNAWYKENDVRFNWELPGGVSALSLDLNKEPIAVPDNTAEELAGEKEFTDVADATWYFHLKYKDARRWGTAGHYRVMIDATPPADLAVSAEERPAGEWPLLRFKATDSGSGLDRYEIVIDQLGDKPIVVSTGEEIYEPSGLSAGEHAALIKAIDKAGNAAATTLNFKVAAVSPPVITDWSREVRPADRFYLNGTAEPEVTINIFVTDGRDIVVEDEVQSDASGQWLYLSGRKLTDARYTAWAESVNRKGMKSGPSNEVVFLVTAPVFARIGNFVINYVMAFTGLLFLIILVLFGFFFLIGWFRKKLKKETVDIEEVVKRNLAIVEQMVGEEISGLSQQKTREGFKRGLPESEAKIKSALDLAAQKIEKEIKDVEKILK